jgi:hypothetical protein
MGKETCGNCYVKLAGPVSFCPECERPTPYASDSERLEWDLKQWRSHVDRSVAAGRNPNGKAVGFGSAAPVAVEEPVEAAPASDVRPRIVPMPVSHSRFSRLQRKAEPAAPAHVESPEPAPARETEPAVERDRDHEFAYDRCATCGESDWIVRYSRNEDETWNYWCVRCSRSFKTEVKLRHALKPFLFGGGVVGGLTAASMLLFR